MGADFPRWGKSACSEPPILTPITEFRMLPFSPSVDFLTEKELNLNNQ